MGIQNLNTFLKSRVPNSMRRVHMNIYKGKRIAIDTSIYFYRFLYRNPLYIELFLEQIFKLVQNGLSPIYIFDGIPPVEKQPIIKQRKMRKDNIKDKLKNLKEELTQIESVPKDTDKDDTEIDNKKKKLTREINSAERQLIYVTEEHNIQLKHILTLLGIPFLQANGEADALCGELVKRDKVDLVLSDDMDLLVDGGNILLREYNSYSCIVKEYDIDKILKGLNFTKKQWIDFCILCGCDYTTRIPGLGPVNSYKLIQKEGSLTEVIKKYVGKGKKYNYKGEYPYKKALQLLTESPQFPYDTINLEKPENITGNFNELMLYCSVATEYGENTLNIRLNTILNR
jgi:flap endonuclease-1